MPSKHISRKDSNKADNKNGNKNITNSMRAVYRREFLKFLAGSPLLTSFSAFAQEVEETIGQRLTNPDQVINVFEMEAVAREKVPPAHFGYLISGVDSDTTLRANREGYTRFQIRPRRLVDVSGPTDMAVNVLGAEARSPIFLSPIGRPYCWGLGAFGQAGVERVLDLLNRELGITMRGSGTPAIADIGPDYIQDVGHTVPRGTLGRELI